MREQVRDEEKKRVVRKLKLSEVLLEATDGSECVSALCSQGIH